MTAVFEDKLRDAGYPLARDRLYMMASQMLRRKMNNGELIQALRAAALRQPELIDAAMNEFVGLVRSDMESGRKPSGGQTDNAQQGHSSFAADTLQSEGQASTAHQGQPDHADALQPERDGEATISLPQGHICRAEPSRPTIDLRARRDAALAASKVHVGALSSFKVRDGRGIGSVQFHELAKLAAADKISVRVAESIQRHSPHADPFARVCDVIKESDLILFIRQAEGRNDE